MITNHLDMRSTNWAFQRLVTTLEPTLDLNAGEKSHLISAARIEAGGAN